MKYYLKEDIDKAIDKIKNNNEVIVNEFDKIYMAHYKYYDEDNHEVVRINKEDHRVIFSATSSFFRDILKNDIICLEG